MTITFIIIAVTAIVSIGAFNNVELLNKLILWPRQMNNPGEYYRFITSGFIHNDWNHLIFNMIALWIFGDIVERMGITGLTFILIYLSGIVIASLPSFVKNRNNSFYRSLGASGGVSSIIFLTIYFLPWSQMGLMFVPGISIPAILFAVLYLAYSVYMSKRGSDNVNHDAHIWGSVYGFVIGLLVDPTHGASFINQMMHPQF